MARDAETTRWTMYVDESGNFDDQSDEVLVGGLLLQTQRCASFDQGLKRHLQTIMPMAPWPLHAWLLHRPEVFAFLLMNTPGVEGDRARSLIATARQREDALVSQLEACFARGDEPSSPNQLRRVRKAMQYHAEREWDGLEAFVRTLNSKLSTALVTHSLAHEEVRWFTSMESHLGDARPDRYLELLVVLMERTRDALLELDGAHHVDIHLATRRVNDPTLSMPRQLDRDHIGWASQEISHSRCGPARVRFGLGGAHDYDDNVPPGIVLADLFANRSRHQSLGSRRSNMSCSAFIDAMHALTGIEGRVGEKRLPCVSTSGVAREQLNAVREARMKDSPASLNIQALRRASEIARTQAIEWEAHVQ